MRGGYLGSPYGGAQNTPPIENTSPFPDGIETSFWYLSTRLDVLSKKVKPGSKMPDHPFTPFQWVKVCFGGTIAIFTASQEGLSVSNSDPFSV